MITKTFSASIQGIDAFLVEIEVKSTQSGENDIVSIVGLPDAAVRESRERVKSALLSCHYQHPYGYTVVNLSPADVKKEGAMFDLPIAIGMIGAVSDEYEHSALHKTMIVGELALDGTVRPGKGTLVVADLAKKQGFNRLLVPMENALEAGLVTGIDVIGISSLTDAIDFLSGEKTIAPTRTNPSNLISNDDDLLDFTDLKGQEIVRRGMEVAASTSVS